MKISKNKGHLKLSIEEKMKQTKITEMLGINKQSDENITVEVI